MGSSPKLATALLATLAEAQSPKSPKSPRTAPAVHAPATKAHDFKDASLSSSMSTGSPSPPLSPPLNAATTTADTVTVPAMHLTGADEDARNALPYSRDASHIYGLERLAAASEQERQIYEEVNKKHHSDESDNVRVTAPAMVTYVDGMPVTVPTSTSINGNNGDLSEDETKESTSFASSNTATSVMEYIQNNRENINTESSIWNANKLFHIGFRMSAASYSSSVDSVDDPQSILDDDAKRMLSSREGIAADERMFVARTKELLRKFFDLEKPKLTEQMLEFLLMDGVLDVFMNFVTRLPWSGDRESIHTIDWSLEHASSTIATLLLHPREREEDDIELQKLSYQAVDILCGTAPSNVRLLDAKQRDIVCRLFDIFHPDADGNFHHAEKLLTNLLRRDPTFFLDLLLLPHPPQIEHYSFARSASPVQLNGAHLQKPLIFRALPYITATAAQEMIVTALFRGHIQPPTAGAGVLPWARSQMTQQHEEEHASAAQKMKGRYEVLQEQEFLEELLQIILVRHDDVEKAADMAYAASELLARVIDEALLCDHSAILFISLAGDRTLTAQLVERLTELDTETHPRHKHAIVRALHALIILTKHQPLRPVGPPGSMPAPVTTPLASISRAVCRQLKSQLASLSNYVIDYGRRFGKKDFDLDNIIKLNSYHVTRPLPTDLIQFLECFVEVTLALDAESPEISDIPSHFWKLLADWFFENSHNNIYHSIFYRLFHQAIRWNHRPTLKSLLSKPRLIPRLVSCIKDDPHTGLRGHLILLANILRLTADEQEANDYIPQLVDSYPEWKGFVDELIEMTKKQVAPILFENSYQAHTFRPLPQIAPDCANVVQRSEDEFDDLGVHLGSTYARSLGFATPPSTLEAESTPTNVVKDALRTPTLSTPVASECGTPVTASKKKTKRKKKRKSAAKSLLGSETDESEHIDNADGVGSDEEDEEEGSGQRTPTATSVSKILDTTLLEQRLNASAAIN